MPQTVMRSRVHVESMDILNSDILTPPQSLRHKKSQTKLILTKLLEKLSKNIIFCRYYTKIYFIIYLSNDTIYLSNDTAFIFCMLIIFGKNLVKSF
jgi:hypothetical protein